MDEGGSFLQGPRVTRREVLIALGAGGALTAMNSLHRSFGLRTLDTIQLISSPGSPSIVLQATRREDMLNLRIEGWNLQLGPGPSLERITALDPAFVVVELPGQHLLEQAVHFGDPVPTPGSSIGRLLANPTRLAFRIPNAVTSIPADLDSLLDWLAWQPSLVAAALPPNPSSPTIAQPTATETAIEAPWQLVMSPDANGRWSHRASTVDNVVDKATWTEVWHTMLGVDDGAGGVNVPPGALPYVRAIWTPGYPTPQSDPITPTSLTAAQRTKLVHNMSSYVNDFGGLRTPAPARAELLMLTPLGATMNVAGYWSDSNLVAWRHRASLGRDAFVRVVEKGYLYPFGHPASLVTITERIFAVDGGNDVVAYLRQRQFVVVRGATVDYSSLPFSSVSASDQRESPFRRVELTTLTTPDLDLLSSSKTDVSAGLKHPDCFWLVAGGNDVAFGVHATDWSGRVVSFDAPMIFVKAGAPTVNVYDPTLGGGVAGMLAVRNAYVDPANDDRRRRAFNGQTIAYASPDDPGDTDVVTNAMTFDTVAWAGDSTTDAPAFFGVMSSDPDYGADVHLATVKALTGQDTDLRVVWSDVYITDGFNAANAGHSFLEVPPAHVIVMEAPAAKVGGMATPTQNIEVLTKTGPKGDRKGAKAGEFDPSSIFPENAKVMGGLRLDETLVTLKDPQLTQQKGLNFQFVTLLDVALLPIGYKYILTFNPDLQPDPLGLLEVKKDKNGKLESTLSLIVQLVFYYDSRPQELTVHGTFEKIVLHLFGQGDAEFFALHLDEVTFDLSPDADLKVHLKIEKIAFGAAMSWIKDLVDLLPKSAVPFGIELGPDEIEIKTNLPHLGISVGLFSIQNLKVDMGLALPYDGSAAKFKFYFSEKDDPFIVSITFFGGGGYVEVVVGINGAERITVGFSFGMVAEIDIGIGSGGVYMMVGIIFTLDADPNRTPEEEVTLVGFFRAGGAFEVLGLVSITIDLYLALAYKPEAKSYGKATFTISIAVSLFSLSASFECERQLSGSASDPGFTDQFSQQNWNEYCAAFAA
jgi:hypothetical protein